MDTLIQRYPLRTNEDATKPQSNTGNKSPLPNEDVVRPTFSPRDRDAQPASPLVGGSALDLAGQASAVDMDPVLPLTPATDTTCKDELNESTFEMERNFAVTLLDVPRNDALLGSQLPTPATDTKSMDVIHESTFEMERNFAVTLHNVPRNDALLGSQLLTPATDTK